MATSPPTNEDLQWKVIKFLRKAGRRVMYKVFFLGTPTRDVNQDLFFYLESLPPTSTVNYLKLKNRDRTFNATQVALIRNNTSGDSFDITLLFHIIKLLCENVAVLKDPAWKTTGCELENCVYMIKQERNKFMHEVVELTQAQFIDKMTELRELFTYTLNAAQRKYSGFTPEDLTKEIAVVDKICDEISQEVISLRELQTSCSDMLINDLEPMCRKELKNDYLSMCNINPVSFVLGRSLKMDVSLIFTDIEVEYPGSHVKQVVSYTDFFVEVQRSVRASSRHHSGLSVVLLEGLAGAGKTTLLRYMVKEWCEENQITIRELDTYQVVLHVMCRDNSSTNSYERLLQLSLPSTFIKYRSLMEPLLSQCRILVLIDGFDEASEASRQLVRDLFCQLRNVNATIVCTSRPECISDLHHMVNRCSLLVTPVRIKGVHEKNRQEFIEKSHKEMKKQTGSRLDTDILLDQLRELVKNEHYRLALNLILATWVCDQGPKVLGPTTTQTELYHHTIRLSILKLKERLVDHSKTSGMEVWLRNEAVDAWQHVMHKEQFDALVDGKVILPHDAVERLRNTCLEESLPADEMLGACLSFKSITPTDTQYEAPHKGLQEFFAAKHVIKSLGSHLSEFDSIRTLLERACGDKELKDMLPGFQNLLQHIAGLLHIQTDPAPDSLAQEVVQLLSESGVNQRDQWLDVIAETYASPTVLETIATIFPVMTDEYMDEEAFEQNAIVVIDSRAKGYSKLLPHLQPLWVHIKMTDDPTVVVKSLAKHTVIIKKDNMSLLHHLPPSCVALTIQEDTSCLAPVLHHLSRHRYKVVRLWHDFHHPKPTIPTTDHILENSVATDQCLTEFIGQLSASVVSKLQHSHTIEWLHLSLASDREAVLLTSLRDTLTHVVELSLHVTPDVSPAAVTTLPDVISTDSSSRVDLNVSGVCSDKMDWAISLFAALQPPSGYNFLNFPRSSLDQGEWTSLIHSMVRNNIKCTRIIYDSGNIRLTLAQEREVADLAWTTLNTRFRGNKFLADGW